MSRPAQRPFGFFVCFMFVKHCVTSVSGCRMTSGTKVDLIHECIYSYPASSRLHLRCRPYRTCASLGLVFQLYGHAVAEEHLRYALSISVRLPSES